MTLVHLFLWSSASGVIREVRFSTSFRTCRTPFGKNMNTGQIVNTSHPRLRKLLSSGLDHRTHLAGSNEALYSLLSHSPEVRELRAALGTGEILESEIREFTAALLGDFRPGVLFAHDIILAAFAVALSREWNTPFAEEYIIDLAKLKNPEFRRSVPVARLAARRLYGTTDTLSRSFRATASLGAIEPWRLIHPGREECSDQRIEFTL